MSVSLSRDVPEPAVYRGRDGDGNCLGSSLQAEE